VANQRRPSRRRVRFDTLAKDFAKSLGRTDALVHSGDLAHLRRFFRGRWLEGGTMASLTVEYQIRRAKQGATSRRINHELWLLVTILRPAVSAGIIEDFSIPSASPTREEELADALGSLTSVRPPDYLHRQPLAAGPSPASRPRRARGPGPKITETTWRAFASGHDGKKLSDPALARLLTVELKRKLSDEKQRALTEMELKRVTITDDDVRRARQKWE